MGLLPDVIPRGFVDDVMIIMTTLKRFEDYATKELKAKTMKRVSSYEN